MFPNILDNFCVHISAYNHKICFEIKILNKYYIFFLTAYIYIYIFVTFNFFRVLRSEDRLLWHLLNDLFNLFTVIICSLFDVARVT